MEIPVQEGSIVHCGRNLLKTVPSLLRAKLEKIHTIKIVTDTTVGSIHLPALLEAFKQDGAVPEVFTLPPGEATKSRYWKERIEDFLFESKCGRDSCLIALGGGVVGDLTGFVAATFLRGIPVVQVPTSLLAMVDSSVGGKTAIDVDPFGKNLLGAFWQPAIVVCDMDLLDTLPEEQIRNGMAEVVKMALIRSPSLLTYLEANVNAAGTKPFFEHVVAESVRLKAEVVQIDEREAGLRAILNYGHTVGHAIESVHGILHGFAVSIGMVVEAQLAKALGILGDTACSRIVRLLKAYELPTDVPKGADLDRLCTAMGMDKKNRLGCIRVSLLDSLGHCVPEPVAVNMKLLRWALAPDVIIRPVKSPIMGNIRVPGSKSLSNRALLLAALGKGPCTLENILLADDTLIMIQALRDMGIAIDLGSGCHIRGGALTSPEKSIYVGNAGTATRFLLAASLFLKKPVEFTGSHRMNIRPQEDLVDALHSLGCRVECHGNPGCLPLKVYPNGFPGGLVQISGETSSQYVSALLLCAPWASSPLSIEVTNLVSRPFVDMTLELMRQFGHRVTESPTNTFHVELFQHTNPASYFIEPDASSSTYSLAMAAATGGDVCVEGLHRNSLQGDAQFAWKVLEPMGCTVEDTPKGVRVRGPKKLKPLGEVDMSDVTDTFLTAVALGALADGRTACTNIANQRVKECNRLEAMTTNLRKLGVRANELPDGIEVFGPVTRCDAVSIPTYDDHRIAMSFAVTSTVVPNIRILDKACVGKTYSDFWCDLHHLLNVDFEDPASTTTHTHTLFLIGMRGSGKTTLGKKVATLLGLPFTDLDHLVEETVGPIGAFVEKFGWLRYREEEHVILKTLGDHGGIVACGDGIVEFEASRAFLKSNMASSCFIHRHVDDILASLDDSKPAWGDTFDNVYQRRLARYLEADRVFTIRLQDMDIDACTRDLAHLVAPIVNPQKYAIPRAQWDDALFLSNRSSIELPLSKDILDGVDAVEIRVDLVKQDIGFMRQMLATFKRHHRDVPILWALCSSSSEEMVNVGVQGGAALLDIEMAMPPTLWPRARAAADRGELTLVLSHHGEHVDVPTTIMRARHIYANCIPKVVTGEDAARKLPYDYGHVTLCAGDQGTLSRVLNRTLTPVIHPSLTPGASGQLSAAETMSWRKSFGLQPRERRFYDFGHPILGSFSPCLHNAAFVAAGKTNWTYTAYDTEDANAVAQILSRGTSGGASISMPLKERIVPYLHHLTDSAEAIGEVNTIKVEDGRLLGENTEWKGLMQLLYTAKRETALVIGASGTARAAVFALQQLKFHNIYIFARAHDEAAKLALEFGCECVKELPSSACDAIVSTIPGGEVVPVFGATSVCVDAYASGDSPFLEKAYASGDSPFLEKASAYPCACVSEGLDLLFLQAVEQSAWWLGESRKLEMAQALRDSASNLGVLRTLLEFPPPE